MKKVFLMHFATPILIEVAKNLKAKGIDIVYWQGYRDAFDDLAKTKTGFENTIFRHAFDAIKNIPPPEVDISAFEPLSKEVIEELYSCGWQALAMVARTDYTNSPLAKYRHLYYSYIKFWRGMIQKLKPDVIVFISVPGSASSFTLYGLAQKLGIKTITLERLIIDTRTLILYGDYTSGCKELQAEYQRIRDEDHQVSELSNDLREYYYKQIASQPPITNVGDQLSHLATRNNAMPFRVPSLKTIIKHLCSFTFLKTTKSYLNMLFSERKTKYHDRDFTGLEMMLMTRRWSAMRKVFRKEYQKLQTPPDYQKKYVYIPLAFQPEQTTSAIGGVFDDQLLMIDIVASSVPPDWMVYVKEHLPQWYPHHTETHLYRYKGYYQEIAAKKNVRLVPAEIHPYELIKNAQAVATVTGTAGWEAVVRGKPALIFGSIWYMYCEGVFKITNQTECSDALEKIKQGYRVNQQRVINYLVALDKVSIKAKHYKTRNFVANEQVSMKENIFNLTEALYKAIMNNNI